MEDSKKEFDWGLYPDLERFVVGKVGSFLAHHEFAKGLSGTILDKTSTRFVDWVDHIVLPESEVSSRELEALGLEVIHSQGDPDDATIYKHKSSYLFPILISSKKKTEVALKPEEIDGLLQHVGSGVEAEGEPFSRFRRAVIKTEGGYVLSAVERRGYDGFVVQEGDDLTDYLRAGSEFYRRQRRFNDEEDGMAYFEKLVRKTITEIGSGRAADAFFRSERAYWQMRNKAGQIQKARQDSMGLGWGNHDHHTYRSSRSNFTKMITVFEELGYVCRERYYAGEKAGWGAQILEHPVCDIVVFADADLTPDEKEIDFAHRKFSGDERKLGTVGLWVGLHGESILEAGMHHLEASDLRSYGISMMPPFSYFAFLKQAFTVGERWSVDVKRLDKLLADGFISREQYDGFATEGAIGSHMENLEREQGFKGFNRASVSKIIMETDPRKQHFSGA